MNTYYALIFLVLFKIKLSLAVNENYKVDENQVEIVSKIITLSR